MRRLVLIALASSCLLACASGEPKRVRLMPLEAPSAEDYEEVLERWTRSDKVYELLEGRLFVSATFHSPEFRQAFVLAHPNVYGRGSDEARRLATFEGGAEENFEFFFSAYTADASWNDFGKDDSIWRVTLEGEDGERVDGAVTRLKTNANLRAIYPYVTPWARTYSVRFPRTGAAGQLLISPAARHFTLRFSSALGEGVLTWHLEPVEFRPAPSAR